MLLSEICGYLNAMGIAASGVDLFYGPMQEQYPDAVVLIQQYGGLADEPSMGDIDGEVGPGRETRIEYPRFTVLCRGAKNDTDGPYQKSMEVRAALVQVLNQTLSNVRYLNIEALQPPIRLAADENFREKYNTNYQATKEPSPTTNPPNRYAWIQGGGWLQ
jgi:hypothetical protein